MAVKKLNKMIDESTEKSFLDEAQLMKNIRPHGMMVGELLVVDWFFRECDSAVGCLHCTTNDNHSILS